MMKKRREWHAMSFSSAKEDTTHVIVDNRLETQTKYTYYSDQMKLKKDSMLSFKWTPAIVIKVSEAYPPDEAKELGDLLAKLLNANWVKEQLDGA